MDSEESKMHPDIRSAQFLGKAAAKPPEGKNPVQDPVCGMALEQNNAVGRVRHKKTLYYFCSPGCQAAFLDDPLKYLPGVEGHNENRKAEGWEP